MATTTNYGWTTPDDTALVKDGASAIRTLGSSVDTTTKALNPSTTLGDVEYRSSTANTNTRLGIGSTGDVLTVAGGVPSWAAPVAGGMTLLETLTLSTASVTSSSIPGTYKDLRIVIRNFKPAGDNTNMQFRFNSDSGSNRYNRALFSQSTDNLTFNDTFAYVSGGNDNSVAQGLTIQDIPDYANATTWKTTTWWAYNNNATTTTNFNFWQGFSVYNQTAAITTLNYFVSGTTFTSGTVEIYGVK